MFKHYISKKSCVLHGSSWSQPVVIITKNMKSRGRHVIQEEKIDLQFLEADLQQTSHIFFLETIISKNQFLRNYNRSKPTKERCL
jgi:hypothetical protein